MQRVIPRGGIAPMSLSIQKKYEMKNKSYVFVHIMDNHINHTIIVLAPNDQICIRKIINKYSLFDNMVQFLFIKEQKGSIEILADGNQAINEECGRIFLEAYADNFFGWFPCNIGGNQCWDLKIVEKLV